MSCVVAIAEGNTVYMGADSAGTVMATLDQVSCKTPKIYKEGEFLIGVVGSFRGLQLIKNNLDFEELENNIKGLSVSVTPAQIVSSLVEDMRSLFIDFGHTKYEDGQENGDNYLIGYKGSIFLLQPEYDIMEPRYPYYALGNGDLAAFGALYATRETDLSPFDRIAVGLEAAQMHNGAVREPWVFDSVGGDDG